MFVQTATKQDTQWWCAEGLRKVMGLDKTKPLAPFWSQVVNGSQYHLVQLGSNDQLERNGVEKETTMFNTLVQLPHKFHMLLRFMSKIQDRTTLRPSRETNLLGSSSTTSLLSKFVRAVQG